MKNLLSTRLFVIAISLMVLAACNDKPTTGNEAATETSDKANTTDLSQARLAINNANTQLSEALARGDSSAIAALYTTDAKVMPEGTPSLIGTDEIKSMWGGMARMGLKVKLDIVDTWGSDDLVVEEGKYTMTDKQGKQVDEGKYIVVWKNDSGNWKIFRDIFNSNGKAQESK